MMHNHLIEEKYIHQFRSNFKSDSLLQIETISELGKYFQIKLRNFERSLLCTRFDNYKLPFN